MEDIFSVFGSNEGFAKCLAVGYPVGMAASCFSGMVKKRLPALRGWKALALTAALCGAFAYSYIDMAGEAVTLKDGAYIALFAWGFAEKIFTKQNKGVIDIEPV